MTPDSDMARCISRSLICSCLEFVDPVHISIPSFQEEMNPNRAGSERAMRGTECSDLFTDNRIP
jgi:hypothetical protein